MFKLTGFVLILFSFYSTALGCNSTKTKYVWNEITSNADYPTGYNYPVFVLNDKMLVLNNGGWISQDGKNWMKTELPKSGLNSAFQKYVQIEMQFIRWAQWRETSKK